MHLAGRVPTQPHADRRLFLLPHVPPVSAPCVRPIFRPYAVRAGLPPPAGRLYLAT